MKKSLFIAFVAVLAVGCSSTPNKSSVSSSGEIEKEWAEEGITKNYIFARGIGAADQTQESATQRRANSRDSAIVNAQYHMLSFVKGVTLEGGITVEKAILTDSVLATKIDATIKGAYINHTEWTNDDGCVIQLKLPKAVLKDAGMKIRE